LRRDASGDEETPLSKIANKYTSDTGTALLVEQELANTFNAMSGYTSKHHLTAHDHLDTFDVSIKACRGQVQEFTSWGRTRPAYLATVREPGQVFLGVWRSEANFENGEDPKERINVLRITSIQPGIEHEVFTVNYMLQGDVRKRRRFERVDRNRDVWVDLLQLMVDQTHKRRHKYQKKHASKSSRESSPMNSTRAPSEVDVEHMPRTFEAMRKQMQQYAVPGTDTAQDSASDPRHSPRSPRQFRRQQLLDRNRYGVHGSPENV